MIKMHDKNGVFGQSVGRAIRMNSVTYRLLHCAGDLYYKLSKLFNQSRVKFHLYHKYAIPEYDPYLLENYFPFHESKCVRFDYISNEECILDASIIVPLYNSSRYLPNLIEDLVNQNTQYNYEIILVNDGSVDDTDELCKEYIETYPNKIVYIYENNHGISYARNAGIELARGAFISFIDHDDHITADYLELLLRKSKDADIVNCLYSVIRDGKQKEVGISNGFVWGGLYRKSLFNNVRFPIGFWYEDMINPFLLYRIANNVKLVNKVLYSYTISPIQATKTLWRNNNPQALDQLYLVQGLCMDYNNLGYEDDEYIFKRVLKECSKLMYIRTKGLNKEIVVQVFLASRELVLSKYEKNYELDETERIWLSLFMNSDFSGWKLMSNS